jgi:hypothetical protein
MLPLDQYFISCPNATLPYLTCWSLSLLSILLIPLTPNYWRPSSVYLWNSSILQAILSTPSSLKVTYNPTPHFIAPSSPPWMPDWLSYSRHPLNLSKTKFMIFLALLHPQSSSCRSVLCIAMTLVPSLIPPSIYPTCHRKFCRPYLHPDSNHNSSPP